MTRMLAESKACKLTGWAIDIVWETIASHLSSLISVWWEHEDVVDKLKAFSRVSACSGCASKMRLTRSR